MGDWKVILPWETINRVLNPVAASTQNYSALAGTTVVRDTTRTWYGTYSFKITSNAVGEGIRINLDALPLASHDITLAIWSSTFVPTDIYATIGGNSQGPFQQYMSLDGSWFLLKNDLASGDCSGATYIDIWVNRATAGDWWIDIIQVEQGATTFCMGDLAGCSWMGTPHASASIREAEVMIGGLIKDLKDDLDFGISDVTGVGMTRRAVSVDEYATLPGGIVNTIRDTSREFTFIGHIISEGTQTLEHIRATLLLYLDSTQRTDETSLAQPVRFLYTGGKSVKYIDAYYVDGLTGDWDVEALALQKHQKLAIRFIAPDPLWYKYAASKGAILDPTDAITVSGVVWRDKDNGRWENAGVTTPTGATVAINVILWNPKDGKFWVGGNFTGWNGNSGWDYLVTFDPERDVWACPGTPGDMTGIVYSLNLAANGDVLIGFNGVNAAGLANADYLVRYSQSAADYAEIHGGCNGIVHSIKEISGGTMVICGEFTAWDAAAASYLAYWDGSTITKPVGGNPNALCKDSTYNPATKVLYVVGEFTTINGVTTGRAAKLASGASAFEPIGLSTDFAAGTYPNHLRLNNGLIWVWGNFSNVGGNANADGIVYYTGSAWEGLGADGVTGVWAAAFGPDDRIWRCSDAGLHIWTGQSWQLADRDTEIFGVGGTDAIAIGRVHPIQPGCYDVLTGHVWRNQSINVPGVNNVSGPAYRGTHPILFMTKVSGVASTNVLKGLRNGRTGRWIWFDHTLTAGERLTIDFRPKHYKIESSLWGRLYHIVKSGSDDANFQLLYGQQQIYLWMDVSGGTVPTCELISPWAFNGIDEI